MVQLAHRLKIPNAREIIAEYLNKQNEQLMNGHSSKVTNNCFPNLNEADFIQILYISFRLQRWPQS